MSNSQDLGSNVESMPIDCFQESISILICIRVELFMRYNVMVILYIVASTAAIWHRYLKGSFASATALVCFCFGV